jgi:UrcA family protein
MIKLMTSLALAASLAAAAAQAQARANADDSYVASIPYGDLNLASPAGLATLRGRIRGAAFDVCGRSMVVPLAEAERTARCRAEFIRSAESRVTLVLNRQGDRVAGTR